MLSLMTHTRHGLNFMLSRLAALLLVGMTVLVLFQVVTRYLLDNPADFTEELVRYFLIWTGFIGAAYAFSTRQHMALVLVRDRLSPSRKRLLMIGIDLLILLFALFILTIGGFQLAWSARHEVSALLGISRGIVYAMAPISGVLIIIAQVVNLWEDVTGHVIDPPEEEAEPAHAGAPAPGSPATGSATVPDSPSTPGSTSVPTQEDPR